MKHRVNLWHIKVKARPEKASSLSRVTSLSGGRRGVVTTSGCSQREPPSCLLSTPIRFAPFLAQSWPSGHCHREPDPQWGSGLIVGCSRGPDLQSAGIPFPWGCAQRHLYSQPGLRMGQEPGHHLVCQILGPQQGQLMKPWTLLNPLKPKGQLYTHNRGSQSVRWGCRGEWPGWESLLCC